jgi:uncharacterized membrane protein
MKQLLSHFRVQKPDKKEVIFTFFFLAVIAVLCLMPTGFEKQIYMNSEGVKARVLCVNNSGVYNTGLLKQGAQSCTIQILSGSHKGETVEATNLYIGKLEFDKAFFPGETAWVLLERDANNAIVYANMVEHYRIDKELTLIGVFALGLLLLSGFTGIRTLLSFAFALLSIWKILIPGMLRGMSPVLLALIVGNLITIATLLLVAGFTKKAYAAIAGAVACSLLTCLLAMGMGKWFSNHGAVMQWSESLLYAGFETLDLTAIIQAGFYLACSGAILEPCHRSFPPLWRKSQTQTRRDGRARCCATALRSAARWWEAATTLLLALYGQIYFGHDGVYGAGHAVFENIQLENGGARYCIVRRLYWTGAGLHHARRYQFSIVYT